MIEQLLQYASFKYMYTEPYDNVKIFFNNNMIHGCFIDIKIIFAIHTFHNSDTPIPVSSKKKFV